MRSRRSLTAGAKIDDVGETIPLKLSEGDNHWPDGCGLKRKVPKDGFFEILGLEAIALST
jgi:hypothetical protein